MEENKNEEVVNEQSQIENPIVRENKKCKSNKPFVIIIVVIAMALTFGCGIMLGKGLFESKKTNKDSKKENDVVDNNQNDKVDDIVENDQNDIVNGDDNSDSNKKMLSKEEVLSNYNGKSNNLKKLDVNSNQVTKLFEIYHKISNSSKEEIALYQLKESDFIQVDCSFYVDKAVNALEKNGEPTWCGTFTNEISKAFTEKNVEQFKQLMSKNTTEAVKIEILRDKVNELFGTSELIDSVYLQPEATSFKNVSWLSKIPGPFIWFDKVEGKDYYARVSAGGGDPTDENQYILNAAYEDGYTYLVYEIKPVSESSKTHVMVLEKKSNGNYVFVKDM